VTEQWVPEVEGQSPPFEPGNTAAPRHGGAVTSGRVGPDFGAELASGQNEAQAAR
jgi:hypothetical protein